MGVRGSQGRVLALSAVDDGGYLVLGCRCPSSPSTTSPARADLPLIGPIAISQGLSLRGRFRLRSPNVPSAGGATVELSSVNAITRVSIRAGTDALRGARTACSAALYPVYLRMHSKSAGQREMRRDSMREAPTAARIGFAGSALVGLPWLVAARKWLGEVGA